MSTNVVNQSSFLQTTREYPPEMGQLVLEMNKSYVDVANAVNSRIISIFPTTRPALTGENWFLQNNQKPKGFRQIYTFTSTANIAHGIDLTRISRFTRNWGEFTDGTNWYGLIHSSNVLIAGQITFYITPTDIVFLTGGGAPVLTSGTIVLEWLSQV